MAKMKVTGLKGSKGMLENGQTYDSTKVYIETKLDDTKGNAKGWATVEYNYGDSKNFDALKHLTVPFVAEIEFEQVTNGRLMKTIIGTLQPIAIAQSAPKAGA